MNKLTTTRAVVYWIEDNARTLIKGADDFEEVYDMCARIAKAMRVLECVDEMEHMPEGPRPPDYDPSDACSIGEERGVSEGWNACINTLRAALEEVK